MKLVDPANLSLHDELDARIRRSVRHLNELNTAEMRMEFTHPDEFWHWGADYMGRWVASMGLLSRYTRQDYGVSRVVAELISFQNPDGSLGSFSAPHDFQEWFGMGRGLVGLLEYYSVDADPQVLASAIRLGEYYELHYPETAECMYECYSNGLEGIVGLARLTGEARFLALARRMAEASVVYLGIRYSDEVAGNGRRTPCAGQVHCQLATARGLLDLYELTGEERYLQPVMRLHEYILDELLWITGGIGFYYFRPEENETCADADWLRLNLQLWRISGEVRFMHLAERILLNQLYFNQADNGGFCYLRGLQNRAGSVFDACCSHHGPRALYEVLNYIYASDPSGLWINLFTAGEAQVEINGQPITLKTALQTAIDHLEFRLVVGHATGEPLGTHVVRIRMPEWTKDATFSLNGEVLTCTVENGYALISRAWQAGDRLDVMLPFTLNLTHGERLGRHDLNPGVVAVQYGPQVFCLNDAWNSRTRIHLAKVSIASDLDHTFTPRASDRLEARGSTPENHEAILVFSPLAQVGGTPSGAGRIHSVRSPYYKVWIPKEAIE